MRGVPTRQGAALLTRNLTRKDKKCPVKYKSLIDKE